MIEKIKRKGIVLFPALVCLVGAIVVSFFWLQEYRKASFEHMSKFCEIIMEENQQMELQVLSAIKEYQALSNQEIEGKSLLVLIFYKTMNNMPKGSEKRTKYTAYFRDPLARAAKGCGYDNCWLDFSKLRKNE